MVIIVVIAAFTAWIALTFTAMENRHNAKAAETESNSSSTIYIDAKPCVKTICINNQLAMLLLQTSTNTDNNNSSNDKNKRMSHLYMPSLSFFNEI